MGNSGNSHINETSLSGIIADTGTPTAIDTDNRQSAIPHVPNVGFTYGVKSASENPERGYDTRIIYLSLDTNYGQNALEQEFRSMGWSETIDSTLSTSPPIFLPDIGAIARFLNAEPTQKIGHVLYHTTSEDEDVLNVVIKRINETLGKGIVFAQHSLVEGKSQIKVLTEQEIASVELGPQSEMDPLYSHVKLLFKHGKTIQQGKNYVVKSITDDMESGVTPQQLARLNEQALLYYPFGVNGIADVTNAMLYMEQVHLISYDLLRAIRTRLRKNTIKSADEETPEKLMEIRDLLLYTQLLKLAQHQQEPFVPKNEAGEEIDIERDLRRYYRDSTQNALYARDNQLKRDAFNLSIDCFLDILDSGDNKHKVRYIDMYQRNHGLHHPQINTFLDLERLLHIKSRTDQINFFDESLKQVDVHRTLRCAYDLEDFWHIFSDPALKLSSDEELKWYFVFLAAKELMHEYAKPESERNDPEIRPKIEFLERRIAKREFFSDEEQTELMQHLEHNPINLSYFYGMKIYRTIRWLNLIEKKYLPKYGQRRKEVCSGFDFLLEDTIAEQHKNNLVRFMNTDHSHPPGRFKWIQFVTKKLTNQRIEDILEYGIQYDPNKFTEESLGLFNGRSKRLMAEAIARINTLAVCSKRLQDYRNDKQSYRKATGKGFLELISLLYKDLPVRNLSVRERELTLNPQVKYEFVQANYDNDKYNGDVIIKRNGERIKTLSAHVDAIQELQRDYSPGIEPYLKVLKLSCLKTQFN